MTGSTHKKAAISTTLACAVIATVFTKSVTSSFDTLTLIPVIWLPLCIAGGYAGDIDKKKTTAYSWFMRFLKFYTIGAALAIILLLLFQKGVLPIVLLAIVEGLLLLGLLLVKTFVHRRETHSFLFVGILMFINICIFRGLEGIHPLMGSIAFNLGLGFIIGVISHMIVDECNVKPLHWFFPLEIILQKLLYKYRSKEVREKPVFLIPTILKIKASSPRGRIFAKQYMVFCGLVTLVVCTLCIISWRV